MARGYPDYFGRSIWPKYGTGLVYANGFTIDAGDTATPLDLSLPGVLTYFKLVLSDTVAMPDVEVKLYLDEEGVYVLYFNDFVDTHDVLCPRSLMYVVYRDAGPLKVICSNGIEIPFHTSFKIKVTNGGAGGIAGTIIACYYAVT